MYAVVKAGGKQHKVAVGDVVEVNRLDGDAGDEISLPALLVVDGRSVISEASALAKIAVTGEIVGHHKGPKIKILKYKNKTGYRRRIGHRQLLTELLVTDIDDGKPNKKAKAGAAQDETPKAATAPDDKPSKTAKVPTKASQASPAKTTATPAPVKVTKPSKATAASKSAAPSKTAAPSKATKSSKALETTDEKED
ncbi:MAG: 50S ribosomal protein L21 [Geodermatophilaceae bacterium]|nr:50S ribosomal protein L21 [Geodermatophilaceae bacterium]